MYYFIVWKTACFSVFVGAVDILMACPVLTALSPLCTLGNIQKNPTIFNVLSSFHLSRGTQSSCCRSCSLCGLTSFDSSQNEKERRNPSYHLSTRNFMFDFSHTGTICSLQRSCMGLRLCFVYKDWISLGRCRYPRQRAPADRGHKCLIPATAGIFGKVS